MSLIMQSERISRPGYFHREYENDFPKADAGNHYVNQAMRIGKVALPFLSLYKPFSFALSLALGGLRSVASFSQLLNDIHKHEAKECSYALLNVALSIVAFAGTLFAHPLGMLITTVHDCALDSFAIGNSFLTGDLQSALSGSATLLNNTLYLALFLHGGVEIVIASLAMQALMGASCAYAEYQKENYLEAGGHLLMGMLRGNQMMGQMQMLQARHRLNKISQRFSGELNSEINTTSKTSSSDSVQINTQKLNPTIIEAEKVEYMTWNGVLAQVALYVNNISVVTFQGGQQSIYYNGAHLATSSNWAWETVNGIQYAKHIYDGTALVYSTDWSQYIVYIS